KRKEDFLVKPIVGDSGYVMTKVSNNLLNFDMNIVPKELTDALRNAGATPFILPLSKAKEAKEYVDQMDALVLAGGEDVGPLLFYEEPHLNIGEIEPDRDDFELALIEEAWKQKKPILGICRGLQLLNVASNGTLYQDLSIYENLEVNSWLGEALGTEQVVNSYHHQAIKEIGDAFRPVAWSKDGLIEAIESIDPKQKVMAVQWHPELLVKTVPEIKNVFTKFVDIIDVK